MFVHTRQLSAASVARRHAPLTQSRGRALLLICGLTLLAACSSGGSLDGGQVNQPGGPTAGGDPITGGGPTTGGNTNTGGSPNTGSNPNTGGSPTTGGNPNTGGNPTTGGEPPANTLLWSDPSTWSSNSVPAAGDNVLIAAGLRVALDVETPSLGTLAIEGELVATDTSDVAITAADIEVRGGGLLEIGTASSPFTHRATITLTGARGLHVQRAADNGLDNDGVARGIRVRNGGALILTGVPPAIAKTKLNAHAFAGATTFTLAEAVDWRAGDQVAIAMTDFHGIGETEVLTLSVDTDGAATMSTTTALQNFRWGRLQYPIDAPVNGSGMSLTPGTFTPASNTTPTVLDERAEVVNLTRNIVIQGADDADWRGAGFGVHVMVMGTTSVAKIDGVEIRRCGQRQAMGRYPFHWHMLSYGSDGSFRGDASSDQHHLLNSSIHDSQNRAVTIHGTCGVAVEDTSAVDVQGHAFFFEDGPERRNRVTGCVAMKVRDPDQHRLKEHDSRAAGFWMVNPDNTIVGNSASDCDGPGLWNSFATECFGMSANVTMNPNDIGITRFDDNVGHSCGEVGMQTADIVVDEAGNTTDSYYLHDSGDAVLRGNIVWKNRVGGYRNRVRQPNYIGWTCADNSGVDIFGAVRRDSLIDSPLMIGFSLNNATPFDQPQRRAFKSYHFEVDIIDVTAVNYTFADGVMLAGSFFNSANTFVVGGGVLDTSDLYLDPITMQMLRCSGWRLINSNAGYRSASPYFDSFPVQQSNGDRNWALSGAMWDPHGYWGPAGNYLVPDLPFYNHGLSSLQMATPGNGNGLSTSHVFFGLGGITPGEDGPHYGGSDPMAMRLQRLDTNGAVVGDHFIGDADQTSVFRFKHFGIARGGRYRLEFPDDAPPNDFFNVTIDNAWRAEDWFVLALPWSGSVPVTGRLDSGSGQQSLAARIAEGTARALNSAGTSLADVIADPTGGTMWQDVANDLVWVKHVGGLALNVYNYNGTSDASLMRRYQLRLSRP